jgi:hypothetical protein
MKNEELDPSRSCVSRHVRCLLCIKFHRTLNRYVITLRMETAVFVENLEKCQRSLRLTPESQSCIPKSSRENLRRNIFVYIKYITYRHAQLMDAQFVHHASTRTAFDARKMRSVYGPDKKYF